MYQYASCQELVACMRSGAAQLRPRNLVRKRHISIMQFVIVVLPM